jgi:putative PIN family toxin of toxin-antitoxin system
MHLSSRWQQLFEVDRFLFWLTTRIFCDKTKFSKKQVALDSVLPIIPHVLAILDTSVLVAGLRSKRGASFQIIQAIRAGNLRISVSVALLLEYESVLLRSGLIPGFAPQEIHRILDAICLMAQHRKVFFAWRPFLTDPNDDLVLELAVAASAPYIITHNISDFVGSDTFGVRAITPATALKIIKQ